MSEPLARLASRSRPRARRRLMVLPLALVVAVLAIACDDDDGTLPVERAEEPNPMVVQVTVLDDGLDPQEVSLRIPDAADLAVTNESDEECRFYLGPYVRDLVVAPGETEGIGFTVTPVEEGADEQLFMGCEESDERVGTIEVQEQLAPGGVPNGDPPTGGGSGGN